MNDTAVHFYFLYLALYNVSAFRMMYEITWQTRHHVFQHKDMDVTDVQGVLFFVLLADTLFPSCGRQVIDSEQQDPQCMSY